MPRDALRRASEHLKEAGEAADGDEARRRLHEQSDELADLAVADRGPDHGRLARHERIVGSIADEEGEAVADHVEAAIEAIHDYRETIEGV